MKELKQFQCEICKTIYADMEECKECEGSHRKAKSIVRQYFRPQQDGGLKYPYRIVVEMEDGSSVFYDYKKV